MDRGRSEFDGKWGGEGLGWRGYMETDIQFPTILKCSCNWLLGLVSYMDHPPPPKKKRFFLYSSGRVAVTKTNSELVKW